jgi:hypothetical protein
MTQRKALTGVRSVTHDDSPPLHRAEAQLVGRLSGAGKSLAGVRTAIDETYGR